MYQPFKVLRQVADGFGRGCRPVLILAATLLAGCYSLVPVRVEDVKPPIRVRAHLSPGGSERFAPILGSVRSAVDGQLVETTPDGVFLEVPSAQVQDGIRYETLTQKILIPRDDLVGLQRRQLDKFRTYLVAGVGAAAAGALIYDALSGLSGESVGRPGGGGGTEARIPLFILPLR